jgi:hypothetical protein
MPEFMMFSPDDLPDEIRVQIDRHRMEHSEASHAVYRLFEELNEDQIETLARLLRGVAGDESMASYYIGILAAQSARRTGNCLACGRNHEADAHALADGSAGPGVDTDTSEPASAPQQPPMDGGNPYVPGTMGAMIENAVKYHVEPVDEGGYHGKMRCTGISGSNGPCGIIYQSLEDRMLRGPEVCSGCFAKAGQG